MGVWVAGFCEVAGWLLQAFGWVLVFGRPPPIAEWLQMRFQSVRIPQPEVVPIGAEWHLGIQARGPRLWHVRCDPDVLLYEALGMRFKRAGSWSTSPIRPVRVI